MNKDFEFKQLLKAYRRGMIDESTFEQEVAGIGGTSAAERTAETGFKAFGKTYANEREAILELIDRFRAGEGAAEVALNKWADQAKDERVRGGIRMIAEREGYHSRVFDRRLRELGGVKKDDGTEVARQIAYNSDPNLTDTQKLLQATSRGPDPKTILQPLVDFGEAIKEDLLTKEMVQLFAKDEMGSATWIYDTCAMLNGK